MLGGKGTWPAVFATCALDPCLRCQGSKTKSVLGFCKSQHRRCRESDKSLKRVRQMMEVDVEFETFSRFIASGTSYLFHISMEFGMSLNPDAFLVA